MLRRLVSGLTVALAITSPLTLGLPSRHDRSQGPRKYDLTVTWEKRAPNGVTRDVILINGQTPGPMIEVNEGDDVEVTVHNQTPHNTTMHFHGMNKSICRYALNLPLS